MTEYFDGKPVVNIGEGCWKPGKWVVDVERDAKGRMIPCLWSIRPLVTVAGAVVALEEPVLTAGDLCSTHVVNITKRLENDKLCDESYERLFEI